MSIKTKAWLWTISLPVLALGGYYLVHRSQMTDVSFFNEPVSKQRLEPKVFAIPYSAASIFNDSLLRDIQLNEVERFNRALSVAFNDNAQVNLENNAIASFGAVKQEVLKRGILKKDSDVIKNIDWLIKSLELRKQEFPRFKTILLQELTKEYSQYINEYTRLKGQMVDYKHRRKMLVQQLSLLTSNNNNVGVHVRAVLQELNTNANNKLSAYGYSVRNVINIDSFTNLVSISVSPEFRDGKIANTTQLKGYDSTSLYLGNDIKMLEAIEPLLTTFLAENHDLFEEYKSNELDINHHRAQLSQLFEDAHSRYGMYPVEIKSELKMIRAKVNTLTDDTFDIETGTLTMKPSFQMAQKWQAYLSGMGVSNKQLVEFAKGANIIVAVDKLLAQEAAKNADVVEVCDDGSVSLPKDGLRKGIVLVGISGRVNKPWKAKLYKLNENGELETTPNWSASQSVPYYQTDLFEPILNISKYI
ncbi:hypothetical protein [Photobacterium damselae]